MALQCILAGGNRAQLDASGVTAGSYGPSANASPAHSGTFSVPYVTVDKYGRVTAASTKTITLPSDNNTDTKVTNTLGTTTKAYITGTTSSSTNTGTQIFDTGVYLSTTAGDLTATTFTGSGANLTSLNASNISSGTLAAARLATSGVTAGSYGPSANASPAHSGTFSVPYITVDTYGRVTAASTKTITLPSDNNTDVNVTNTLATTTKAYVTGTTSASTNTGTQVFDTGVYLDTTAGRLTATTFNGGHVVTTTNPTSATAYFPTFVTNSGTALRMNDGLEYISVEGTDESDEGNEDWTAGYGILVLGNAQPLSAASSKYGAIRLYGEEMYYYQIMGDNSGTYPTANRTVYMPRLTATGRLVGLNSSSTAAGSTTQPCYITANGIATAMTGALATTYGGTGNTTGTATYATTTADTSNTLYPVGVTSSATTTLKRDTSITMSNGTITATTFSGALSGNASTATLASTVTAAASSSGTWYNLIAVPNVVASDQKVYTMGDQTNSLTTHRAYQANGTTSAVGTAYLELGNSTTSGTVGNAVGIVRLYGNTTYYSQISANASVTANRTLYVPDASGTIVTHPTRGTAVGSSTRPVYISSTGVATAMTGALATTYGGTGTTTGEAPSATKLATAVTIDGVSFDGSAAITHYGTCSTSSATAAKVVTCDSTFSLVTGARIVVLFNNYNNTDSPTLNVNSTGAYAIVGYGTTPSYHKSWNVNSLVEFVFDGTSWVILSIGNEGLDTTATGTASHAEGSNTTATGNYSHAEGYYTTATGNYSHAEGYYTEVSSGSAHAEGYHTITSGTGSHAEGSYTSATGGYSHASGSYTTALAFNTTIGKRNTATTAGSSTSTTGDAFIIGNGTSSAALSNAFRVTYAGATYGLSAFNSSGADYAEFIKEWYDGNPNSEDRIGYFVTIYDGYLYKADEGDYIVGITSGNPSIVGNGDENYYWRYERDEFNRFVYEDVAEMTEQLDDEGNPVIDENGDIVMVETGNIIKNGRMKISDSYDSSQTYIERKDRPEWDYVGMLGVLPVRDDGTCVAGGYCRCADGGIATKADSKADNTYFVIERITDSVISVILK